jgi:putative ABC transport system ATP-binding protein
MTSLIEVVDLHKTYATGGIPVHALQGVSLQIRDTEFVAIMGASGSGKTTLMNILGCLDRPTRGRYRLAGREVSRLSRNQLAEVRSRLLGFVFQSFNLLPRTSALDNVALPLLYAGVGGRDAARRAARALEQVGLRRRIHHQPAQLSGGEQQRVAIARALVNRPRLILADEPTGNLDSRTSLEIMDLFQELGRGGITVVCVTHEPDVAAFARRVVTMLDGRIVRDRGQTPAGPSAGARQEMAP